MWKHSTFAIDQINLAKSHLRAELRSMLAKTTRKELVQGQLTVMRIAINVTVLLAIGALCGCVWYVLKSITLTIEQKGSKSTSSFYLLLPALISTAANIITPVMFSYLSKFEFYSTSEVELRASLTKLVDGVSMNTNKL